MTVTPIITDTPDLALLRLLQLASPALPVGAYAYSQGLECAVGQGWVSNEADAQDWILGLLRHSQTHLDVPLLARLYRCWQRADGGGVAHWNSWLFAAREAAELQQEDHHLGTALAKLLTDLGLVEAATWRAAPQVCFATPFSLAAVRWGIAPTQAALGYLWTWLENQVAAATKLVPLGQTAGQRILSAALPDIVTAVQTGLRLDDADIGGAAPGLGLASAWHETQYSRLFRS